MPKQTFYNLEKEKQNKIIEAAVCELETYKPDEFSINRVIRNAEISRGSFYQYFEDKDDLTGYVLRDFKEKARACAQDLIDKNGLTLAAAKEGLELIVAMASNNREKNILHNISASMKICDDKFFDNEYAISAIASCVNTAAIRFKSEREKRLLVEMGMCLFRDAAVKCMTDIENAELYIEDYEIKVKMLEEGINTEND